MTARHQEWWTTILAISLAIGCAALVGCAPMQFAKDGAAPGDFAKDKYDCEQQWEQSAGAIAFRQDPMGNAFYATQARADLRACLERKGWVRTDG